MRATLGNGHGMSSPQSAPQAKKQKTTIPGHMDWWGQAPQHAASPRDTHSACPLSPLNRDWSHWRFDKYPCPNKDCEDWLLQCFMTRGHAEPVAPQRHPGDQVKHAPQFYPPPRTTSDPRAYQKRAEKKCPNKLVCRAVATVGRRTCRTCSQLSMQLGLCPLPLRFGRCGSRASSGWSICWAVGSAVAIDGLDVAGSKQQDVGCRLALVDCKSSHT